MNLWAVIPSRDRPGMLTSLVSSLFDDCVNAVVIDTGYDPLWQHPKYTKIPVLRDTAEPPNISRWWNIGLDYVKSVEGDQEHVVAVLNDDLVVPKGFVYQLGQALIRHNATVAYPDQHGHGRDEVFKTAGPISLFQRMTGYAFAVRGSAGLRADESLQWWYGDDDLDWRAREMGGSVLVGGLRVEHLSPNSTTVGKLAEQAGRDRQTFANKWGGRTPW